MKSTRVRRRPKGALGFKTDDVAHRRLATEHVPQDPGRLLGATKPRIAPVWITVDRIPWNDLLKMLRGIRELCMTYHVIQLTIEVDKPTRALVWRLK
jgi:hypothetical protein